MRLLLGLVFVSALVVAAPPPSSEEKPLPAEIVELHSEVFPEGSFHYSYEGSDGSKASEEGSLKYVDANNAGEAVSGQYEYVGDDGKLYSVSYVADEAGFRPEGDHIPKVPEPIARALQWAAEHPYKEQS